MSHYPNIASASRENDKEVEAESLTLQIPVGSVEEVARLAANWFRQNLEPRK